MRYRVLIILLFCLTLYGCATPSSLKRGSRGSSTQTVNVPIDTVYQMALEVGWEMQLHVANEDYNNKEIKLKSDSYFTSVFFCSGNLIGVFLSELESNRTKIEIVERFVLATQTWGCQHKSPTYITKLNSKIRQFQSQNTEKLERQEKSTGTGFIVSPAGKQNDQNSQSINKSKLSAIGQKWAVVIGISKYKLLGKSGLNSLMFADDDARNFAQTLNKMGWNDSHIKLLIDEKASKRNIDIALESWLSKAESGDQIVLFWAGHGYPDPEDPEKVYFACYDSDLKIPATGYRMDRVRSNLEERNAKNVIVLADTCHAGKLITRGDRGLSIVPIIKKMSREQKVPKGWIFMVGADTDRQAIEDTSWANGAFTHSLIKGLSGKADGFQSAGAKDGIVTMGELKAYMNTAMPDETQKVLGVAKRPVITTNTGDPDIWNLTLQAK